MEVLPWAAELELNVERLLAGADVFGPAAEAWLAELSMHPWERRDLGRQVWIGGRGVPDPAERAFEPVSGYRGHVFYAPRGGFWTTTAMEGWPLEWFLRVAFMRGTEVRVWELQARPDAKVFQIARAEDWVELVRCYPALAEPGPVHETPHVLIPAPIYMPDWPAVARDWDAVRWTLSGKLRSLVVPWPVLDGYTILIDELVYEQTLWLRWMLDPLREVGRTTT